MDIHEFNILRRKEFTEKIINGIKKLIKEFDKPAKFMHACTYEHTISKYGLRTLLLKEFEIFSTDSKNLLKKSRNMKYEKV